MVNHMINIDREIIKRKAPVEFVVQVHDSMVFYCKEGYVPVFIPWLREICERGYLNTTLKFTVEIDVYKRCCGGEKMDL